MPDEPLALSTIPPAPPSEGDYDAIRAAIMATVRGRWFLEEYARRNRNADTALVLAAIDRIEAVIAGEQVHQARQQFRIELLEMARTIAQTRADVAESKSLGAPISTPKPPDRQAAASDVFAAAERLQDVAWAMRERGFDDKTCDQIEALAATILSASALRNPADPRAHKLGEVLQYLERRIDDMLGPFAVAAEESLAQRPVSAEGADGESVRADHAIDAEAAPAVAREEAIEDLTAPAEAEIDTGEEAVADPDAPAQALASVAPEAPATVERTPADGAQTGPAAAGAGHRELQASETAGFEIEREPPVVADADGHGAPSWTIELEPPQVAPPPAGPEAEGPADGPPDFEPAAAAVTASADAGTAGAPELSDQEPPAPVAHGREATLAGAEVAATVAAGEGLAHAADNKPASVEENPADPQAAWSVELGGAVLAGEPQIAAVQATAVEATPEQPPPSASHSADQAHIAERPHETESPHAWDLAKSGAPAEPAIPQATQVAGPAPAASKPRQVAAERVPSMWEPESAAPARSTPIPEPEPEPADFLLEPLPPPLPVGPSLPETRIAASAAQPPRDLAAEVENELFEAGAAARTTEPLPPPALPPSVGPLAPPATDPPPKLPAAPMPGPTSDPLAALNAMSDEERIALFS